MTTLVSTFSLGWHEFQDYAGQPDAVLSHGFSAGLYFPVRWPAEGDRVVAHAFALKPAAADEMTDLTTTIVRTERLG